MIAFLRFKNRNANALRLLLVLFLTSNSLSISFAACDKEIENAQKIAHRISEEWPLRHSQDSKTKYVQKIADYIDLAIDVRMDLSNFDLPSNGWEIFLVRDLSVNAYSIGNGIIYFTDGTLQFVENEAELAAVVAHEMAHQLIGHFCEEDEELNEREVGSFTQILDNEKEIAADRLAIKILQNTFYPPHAMLDVVKRLPSLMEGSLQKSLRIKSLESLLKTSQPSNNFLSSPEFLQLKED